MRLFKTYFVLDCISIKCFYFMIGIVCSVIYSPIIWYTVLPQGEC